MSSGGVWERRAWAAGIVFVVALLGEAVISAGIPINQDDSAAKIAGAPRDHRDTVLIAAYFSAVFGSVFLVAAGLLAMSSRVLPRWLAWVAVAAGICLFLQGFGLGGVIATFGLVIDLIGFLLFLAFVLLSSVVLLRATPPRASAPAPHRGGA